MIGVKILDKISLQFEDPNPDPPHRFGSNREWITGLDSIRTLFQEAGLEVENAFESDDYENIPARTKSLIGNTDGGWRVEQGGSLFDELVPVDDTKSLGDPGRRGEMRYAFEEEFRKYADEDDKVQEALRFYIGVGMKI